MVAPVPPPEVAAEKTRRTTAAAVSTVSVLQDGSRALIGMRERKLPIGSHLTVVLRYLSSRVASPTRIRPRRPKGVDSRALAPRYSGGRRAV